MLLALTVGSSLPLVNSVTTAFEVVGGQRGSSGSWHAGILPLFLLVSLSAASVSSEGRPCVLAIRRLGDHLGSVFPTPTGQHFGDS